MKSNEQLQQDVLDELRWDPILEASEIGVTAKNGVVTLSGYVSNYAKKYAAEAAAKRVEGVRAVAEDIEVHITSNDSLNDSEIANAILKSWKWNANVPEKDLQVRVENGWVSIYGTVEWQFQKNAAENSVRQLNGVKGVINFITIQPKISVIAAESKIKKALERAAAIEAANINVRAEGSEVILTGKVRSLIEMKEVERAVWSLPGVASIKDELEVLASE